MGFYARGLSGQRELPIALQGSGSGRNRCMVCFVFWHLVPSTLLLLTTCRDAGDAVNMGNFGGPVIQNS